MEYHREVENNTERNEKENLCIRLCRKKFACVMSVFTLMITSGFIMYSLVEKISDENFNQLLTKLLNNSLLLDKIKSYNDNIF